MGDGLRLAFGTLTAVPVPPPRGVDRSVAGRAMAAAPLTTVPALVLLGLWSWAVLALDASRLLGAAVALASLTLLTRAVHLDGLAADGLSASYDRERGLSVMRRSDIGPSGVAAVVLVLVVELAALTALFRDVAGLVLGASALVASRQVLAWACARGVPSARPDGLGATVAGSVPPAVAGAFALLLAALAAVVPLALDGTWWAGPVVVAAALLAGAAVIRRAVRRFGGITGDVLGAAVEISFAAALVVAALVAS